MSADRSAGDCSHDDEQSGVGQGNVRQVWCAHCGKWLRDEPLRDIEINEAVVEAAAKEAFWTDDIGGHHKAGRSPHTWENIPAIGRANYRRLIRAVWPIITTDYRAEVDRLTAENAALLLGLNMANETVALLTAPTRTRNLP